MIDRIASSIPIIGSNEPKVDVLAEYRESFKSDFVAFREIA